MLRGVMVCCIGSHYFDLGFVGYLCFVDYCLLFDCGFGVLLFVFALADFCALISFACWLIFVWLVGCFEFFGCLLA